jgi:hypothetical protein
MKLLFAQSSPDFLQGFIQILLDLIICHRWLRSSLLLYISKLCLDYFNDLFCISFCISAEAIESSSLDSDFAMLLIDFRIFASFEMETVEV